MTPTRIGLGLLDLLSNPPSALYIACKQIILSKRICIPGQIVENEKKLFSLVKREVTKREKQ